MKFSVIIPLEFHRGQGTRCIEAWCGRQTFASHNYEVLCVMPRHYPSADRNAIESVLRDHDLLIESDNSHDMALCVEGAAVARGENLFFTESHVWPEPNVLELCAATLKQRPEWAGFSCKTTRLTSNLLAEVEADMYEADIRAAMHFHPWLKILDQCFVTRRKPYFLSGGFNAKLGHFAEWALSEAYYNRDFKIGYAPTIRLHHFYIGRLTDLNEFTRNFIEGEILYFSMAIPGETLIKPPPEWSMRGNLDRGRSRSIIGALFRHTARQRCMSFAIAFSQIVAYFPVATGRTNLLRLGRIFRRHWCRVRLAFAQMLGSKAAVSQEFLGHQKLLIDDERLRQVALLAHTASLPPPRAISFGHRDSEGWITGFYAAEASGGMAFRWSKPAAAIDLEVPAGNLCLQLRCLQIASRRGVAPIFIFNGRRLRPKKVVARKDGFDLIVKTSKPGLSRLVWLCSPLREAGTKRRLGLPVVSLSIEPRVDSHEH